MYIIYQITNKVNGKKYVGLTNSSLKKRWYQHRYDASKSGSNFHFHRAIRKYDMSDWKLDTLCCCLSKADAEYLECHFIKEHDTYIGGYNMTEGGSAFGGLRGKFNGMYGKKRPKELLKRMNDASVAVTKGKSYEEIHGEAKADQLKQLRSANSKANRQLNPLNGNKNPNFDSTVYTFQHTGGQTFVGTQYDFQQTFGLRRGDISLLIHRKQKSAKGWKLVD